MLGTDKSMLACTVFWALGNGEGGVGGWGGGGGERVLDRSKLPQDPMVP